MADPDSTPTPDDGRSAVGVTSFGLTSVGPGHVKIRRVAFGLTPGVTMLLELSPSGENDLNVELTVGGIPNTDAELYIDALAELFEQVGAMIEDEREAMIAGARSAQAAAEHEEAERAAAE